MVTQQDLDAFMARDTTNEWYTPSALVEPARFLMGGIDLDPASCPEANRVVRAERFHVKRDDGLARPWHGRVWCNPPYSRIAAFAAKLVREDALGNVEAAVLLCNASTDAAWFADLAERYPVLFSRGRVRFWRTDREANAPRFGQALFAVGIDPDAFRWEYRGVAYGVR